MVPTNHINVYGLVQNKFCFAQVIVISGFNSYLKLPTEAAVWIPKIEGFFFLLMSITSSRNSSVWPFLYSFLNGFPGVPTDFVVVSASLLVMVVSFLQSTKQNFWLEIKYDQCHLNYKYNGISLCDHLRIKTTSQLYQNCIYSMFSSFRIKTSPLDKFRTVTWMALILKFHCIYCTVHKHMNQSYSQIIIKTIILPLWFTPILTFPVQHCIISRK